MWDIVAKMQYKDGTHAMRTFTVKASNRVIALVRGTVQIAREIYAGHYTHGVVLLVSRR